MCALEDDDGFGKLTEDDDMATCSPEELDDYLDFVARDTGQWDPRDEDLDDF